MIGDREGMKNFCFEFAMAMKIEDKLAVKIKINKIKESSITRLEYSSVPPTNNGSR